MSDQSQTKCARERRTPVTANILPSEKSQLLELSQLTGIPYTILFRSLAMQGVKKELSRRKREHPQDVA